MTPIAIAESPRAASCVEAGVDFSFRSAFRGSWGLVNLLQIAGRGPLRLRFRAEAQDRSGEYSNTEVRDSRHVGSSELSLHPQANVARDILADRFKHYVQQHRQPSPDDCTEAVRLELRNDRGAQALRLEEMDADTRTVLVDPTLAKRIESRDPAQPPSWREPMQHSVAQRARE